MTTCKWKYDVIEECWHTECGEGFFFEYDGPKEYNFNFCPNCGKRIEITPPQKLND